jgi:hypothetical protein
MCAQQLRFLEALLAAGGAAAEPQHLLALAAASQVKHATARVQLYVLLPTAVWMGLKSHQR